MVGETPYWNFVDWTEEWPWSAEKRIGGVPNLKGGSSILSLQLVYALQDAANIMDATGDGYYAGKYRKWAERLRRSVMQHCWDDKRGLLADTPAFGSYSQHANLWAILTDTITGNAAKQLMQKILSDDSLIQATFYFKFYLFQALYKTGLADLYLDQLEPWKEMLRLGLSTFAEKPDPTRSDCHAWSASPNYDFFATVCGIRPTSAGFTTVSIQPSMGKLSHIKASMPHPKGEISLQLKRKEKELEAIVSLPEGVTGKFTWEGKVVNIHAGENSLIF
jgi:hypothetical protein